MDEETRDLSKTGDREATEENVSKSTISADLIRGHINTIILRALYERDKYGYEIIEEIERKSHGQYTLKQPTLYSALKRLEAQGYINAYWKTDEVSLGGRRKYYTLTDSGREVTEKNQMEWEYSRTVIDNLISDRSFDFSQPAPTTVDFKILKQSTSRVPVIKTDDNDVCDDNDEDKEDDEDGFIGDEITNDVRSQTETEDDDEDDDVEDNDEDFGDDTYDEDEDIDDEDSYEETARDNVIPQEEAVISESKPMDEEQRRIVHENYLKLISEPTRNSNDDIVPVADKIDTDKLIYNNKPETERDYRNLINNLFSKTVTRKPQAHAQESVTVRQAETYIEPNSEEVKLDDVSIKAANDGLKVNTAEYVITGTRNRNYNRGGALFKSSLIITVFLLLEFMFSLLFRKELAVNLAYPFVIFAIAAAQLIIFSVLYFTDLGRTTRKPLSNTYLSASIIVTIILILIIFIVSILLNINFSSTGDIMAKLIIPCLVVLNIPAFTVCFYLFSKLTN